MNSIKLGNDKPSPEHIFDGVHREPADLQAARMLSSKRVQWGPDCDLKDIGDLSGLRVGRLTVLGRESDKHHMWHLRCDCGTLFDQPVGYLRARNALNAMCPACRSPRDVTVSVKRGRSGTWKPTYNVRRSGFTVAQLLH